MKFRDGGIRRCMRLRSSLHSFSETVAWLLSRKPFSLPWGILTCGPPDLPALELYTLTTMVPLFFIRSVWRLIKVLWVTSEPEKLRMSVLHFGT